MTINRKLGRYELLEQLGEGGMGAVWLARLSGSHGFEKLCIVKTVLPSIAKDADFVSRFLHEGRVLTQLAHGNIAQVLDMNEAEAEFPGVTPSGGGRQLFLALEYVAGVDLARLADNVRSSNEFMPLPLIIMLIAQAAEGLGAAHRKTALDGTPLNVVHRDVSPQNIMVSFEGEVKVIDFGIAKSEARSRHTAQASVMGKLGYMAPEQARGENVDHRADQYALAIVLWELLTNQPFIRRGTLTEMVVAMAHPKEKPVTPLRSDVTKSLEAVVTRALSVSPDARYPDTDAFARALTGEVLSLGPPPTKPQLGEYVKVKCTQEFGAQRQLLTRVSTMRGLSSESVRAQSNDPLVATAVRPGPPVSADQIGSPAATVDVGSHTIAARPGLVDPSAMTRARAPGAVPVDARDLPPDVAPVSTTPGRPAALPVAVDRSSSTTPSGGASSPSDPSPTVNDRPAGLTAVLARQGDPALDATIAGRPSSGPSDPSPTVRDRPPGLDAATVAGRPAVAPASTDSSLAVDRPGEEVPHGPGRLATPARPLGDSTVPGRVAVPAVVPTEPGRPAVSSAVVPAQGTPAISVSKEPLLTPLTTKEIAAAIPKRSKAPLIIGGVVVVGLIAAISVATRPSEHPTPQPAVVVDAGAPAPPVIDAGQREVVNPWQGQPTVDAGTEVANDAPKPKDGVITNPPGFDDPPPNDPPSDPTPAKKPIHFIVRTTANTWVISNMNKSSLKNCTLTFPGKRRVSLGTLRSGESREVPQSSAAVSAGAPSVDKKARLDCAEGTGFSKL
ncbi:MAG: protein kinase [Archangium sp.]|nr:protein kinase [Archangium sp.]